MTISEWIKSRIKYDTEHKLTYGQHNTKQTNKHNQRRSFKGYITPKRRGHTVRIGNKRPSHLQRPKFIFDAFRSLSPDMSYNIHCKPQKFAVYYDSFTLGIDNHASTTISNRSSQFDGTTTPVRGEMVKDFGGVVQVKG